MLDVTPQLTRRWILPASCLAFFACFLVSAVIFYRGKAFDIKAAVISDLESPDDNPRGYGVAAAGTAIAAILLVPAPVLFFRCLRARRPKLAWAGAVMFGIGLCAAMAIGVLASFTHGYTPAHVHLASAAFIGICSGTLLHLIAARASRVVVAFQFGVLVLLVYLCYGPMEFDNDHLLTGLAFGEWVLCLDCVAGLWALTGAIEKEDNVQVKRFS